MPFATVIVPTYNQEEFVREALDSLLGQTDPDWEAVVVNDGSTDGTAKILDEYARRDSRFRIIHKKNGGVASALNAGLEAASGAWVHWLSSDDYFEPGKLEINRRWIDDNRGAEFFYSYFRLLRQNLGIVETRELWGPRPNDGLETLGLVHRNFVSGISICVNRKAWLRHGTFDAGLHYGQDLDMWLRLLSRLKACFIPEHLVVSRNHDAQGSETFPAACYFDSAKACLKLARDNSFQAMVPYADLTDPAVIESAYQTAMAAASDPISFLYRLGPAPDFAARIAEWLWSPAALPAVRDLRQSFLRDAAALTLQHQKSDFGTMWGAVAASVSASGEAFRSTPTDPLTLTKLFHRRLIAVGKEAASRQTEAYLERFHGVRVPAPKSGVSARILLLGGDALSQDRDRRVAEELAKSGHLTVCLGDTFGLSARGFTVPHQVLVRAADDLPRLGRFDVLVVKRENTEVSDWVDAGQFCDPDAGIGDVLRRIPGATDTPKSKMVLLGLSPAGGGAEKVLSDMSAFIDRSRFDVTLAYLTWNDLKTDFPAGAQVVSLGRGVTSMGPLESVFGIDVSLPAATLKRNSFFSTLKDYVHRHTTILQTPWRAAYSIYSRGRQAAQLVRCALGKLKRKSVFFVSHMRTPAHSRPRSLAESALAQQFGSSVANLKTLLAPLGPDDVLVTFMEHAAVLSRMCVPEPSFRTVSTLHTLESAYLRQLFGEGELHAGIKAMLSDLHKTGKVTFPSKGCALDFDEYLGSPVGRSQSIANPINLALSNLQGMAGLPSEFDHWFKAKKIITCIARLDSPKDHATLFRAVRKLSSRVPDVALVCVGSGSLEVDLKGLANELGISDRVLFAGYQANPMPFVKASRVSVLSSDFEAFGLVIIEAMAVGTPVVATDCPFGPAEIIGPDNAHGILVPPADAAALAAALEGLLTDDDLHAHYRKTGISRARDFSYFKSWQKWSEVFDADVLPGTADTPELRAGYPRQ